MQVGEVAVALNTLDEDVEVVLVLEVRVELFRPLLEMRRDLAGDRLLLRRSCDDEESEALLVTLCEEEDSEEDSEEGLRDSGAPNVKVALGGDMAEGDVDSETQLGVIVVPVVGTSSCCCSCFVIGVIVKVDKLFKSS